MMNFVRRLCSRLRHASKKHGHKHEQAKLEEVRKASSPKEDNTFQVVEQLDEYQAVLCPVCLEELALKNSFRLTNCSDFCCDECLAVHMKMQIMEGNGKIGCPVCSAEIHGNDVYGLLEGNKPILDRYEKLSLRRALAENPNMRWCPAPDCDYGVLAENCDRCPLLYCQRKGCETSFCYICRQRWTDYHRCVPESIMLTNAKHCPRCRTCIEKIDDRCNYMVCSVCGSNFCWLCARETGGGHFIFPSGCPLWGKKRWSKTQRLFWLVATIIVSPAVLALEVTGTILVALFVLPTFVFINKFAHLKQSSALKSSATAAAAFLGQLALAPVFSALAVMNELVGYFKYVLRCIGDLSN